MSVNIALNPEALAAATAVLTRYKGRSNPYVAALVIRAYLRELRDKEKQIGRATEQISE